MNHHLTHKLKSGYTTGTCASAAAKAAAVFLLTGICPEVVDLTLPNGEKASWKPEFCAAFPGTSGKPESSAASELSFLSPFPCPCFLVQKDAGDDPDVTDGAWICAAVTPIDRRQLEQRKAEGRGYWLEAFPNLYLNGGYGIGLVTKPGLSCPPGHYAINPVPRQMILGAVYQVCVRAAYEECLEVEIAIPDGNRLAEKTFNPRLGIENGISVLGTTGIVKPMSEEALLETIRLDIHMKVVSGETHILMAPGNYGETFLQQQMGVPLGEAVLCSNFVGDAARMLAAEGVESVLFAGHIGKLIKVAAGVQNTHSRYGDGRMEQMAVLVGCIAPDHTKLQQQVLDCNTTEEAIGILKEAGLAEQILDLAAEQVKEHMEVWSGGKVKVQVVTFSSAYGILGRTGRGKAEEGL